MCGICGVYDSTRGLNAAALSAMCDSMFHRGPDDGGIFIDREVGLGIRRLSIIDLTGGHQPIYNESKDICIVFNGEIYNYIELRKELLERGHVFHTLSDTEVIVHLYEEFDKECVNRLNGMFAFAIYDMRKRQIFIARDRFGIKPLYYYHGGGRFLFASELKAILQYPDVSLKELDFDAISDYLTYMYVPAPNTILKGIRKLLPAHFIIFKEDRLTIERYWDVDFEPMDSDEDEYKNRISELLIDSLRLHSRSDVPFGVFLSGGIDSSTIVALLSTYLGQRVKTFSVGFGDRSVNELKYAKIVSDKFNTEHHEITVSVTDAIDNLVELLWHMDEPIADSAIVPTYLISKATRRYVKMALSGLGGDELFAGYSRYKNLFHNKMRIPLPTSFVDNVTNLFDVIEVPRTIAPANYIRRIFQDYSRNYFYLLEIFPRKLKCKLLNRTMRYDSRQVLDTQFRRTEISDRLNHVLFVDMNTYLPDDILFLTDRVSMACSLEVRVPFLDYRFVEFVFNIPGGLKLRGDVEKYILKEALKPTLPATILQRFKWGFGAPILHWFEESLWDISERILLSPIAEARGYFNPKIVRALFRLERNGLLVQRIWGLLVLELWMRIYIDRESNANPTFKLKDLL